MRIESGEEKNIMLDAKGLNAEEEWNENIFRMLKK